MLHVVLDSQTNNNKKIAFQKGSRDNIMIFQNITIKYALSDVSVHWTWLIPSMPKYIDLLSKFTQLAIFIHISELQIKHSTINLIYIRHTRIHHYGFLFYENIYLVCEKFDQSAQISVDIF